MFGAGLWTNLDDSELRRSLGSVGAQIDIRFTLLSHLDLTLSFGAAIAVEDGSKPRDELMLSLKLL